MQHDFATYRISSVKWCLVFVVALIMSAFLQTNVQAFDLTVKDGQTDTAIGVGYRWLLEEDVTHHVEPTEPATNWATKFHKSYMPVVAKGDEGVDPPTPPTNTHYYVSVLPYSGYSMGGAQVEPEQGSVTVYVQPHPIPTAQISVFVFHDNNPINNAPDLPAETPGTGDGQTDMSGFTVKLEDAGGRYGASAGEAFANVFGHPIGTTYTPGCDPNTGGDACIDQLGQGFLVTGPDGEVIVQNMAPGKYGVFVIPPAGQGWQQTNTIEGKKIIDAWVKANEPPFFAEFGPPGWHAFFGFTKEYNNIPPATGGVAATISGQVVNNHLSRPPDTAFYDGAPPPHTTPWVGLNANGGIGPAIYVSRTDGGAFSIPNVPPGDYQLAVFDDNMDFVFHFVGINVNADGSCSTPDGNCNVGNVPVFDWFTKIWAYVFDDINENGILDVDEAGIPEVLTGIRWRDGTLYQEFPTDTEGFAPYDEVFPFFSWLVAEVGFGTLKATGATIVPDGGGAINPLDPWTFGGQLNPQIQADSNSYRVETGPVLTQAFQGFLGQTSVIQFGKTSYETGQNGGISGVVYYDTTRDVDDPELSAPQPWEPGIPDVTVNLYGVGPDMQPNTEDDVLLATTTTDNWDASLPTNCPGDNQLPGVVGPNDCFDGMRNWNQVRPGIFDGGYAFGPEIDCNPASEDFIFVDEQTCEDSTTVVIDTETGPARYLNTGDYVVEVVPPTAYEIGKSQDRNVDFGDTFIPAPELLPVPCVGAPYPVPDELSLFPGVEAPLRTSLTGKELPLCDRKLVALGGADNAAADFFLFTEVPIAAHVVGGILDDTANEFDPNSPQYGEKFAPPWLPVGIYDWTGRLIGETVSDQWGRFNALVPSTYTQNLPMPSGTSPNMLTTCMNDPSGPRYGDQFNPQYSTFCYTFQYMPGATTYLDTPVVPVAAFAGPDQFPLDCELPDGTPKIYSVTDSADRNEGSGPYLASAPGTLYIHSMGTVTVPNPDYGKASQPKTITRDYSFGTQGAGSSVTIGGILQVVNSWTNNSIQVQVANGGQLVVTRDNGLSTVNGVTVQVGLRQGAGIQTVSVPSEPGVFPGAIQQAIDAAGTNDLILVAPGVYNEFVIMYKPVQLQGWGAGSTEINAVKGVAAERLTDWRAKVEQLVTDNVIDMLPGQEAVFGGIEPVGFFTEEGAGVLVVARRNGPARFARDRNRGARIDGFTVRGADQGGGIVANGYTDYLEVSNNLIKNNSGFFGGGFRSGHPQLDNELVDSDNDNIRVHHNMITQNGGLGGAGGGVALCTGSDGYQVTDNFICGNFALTDGGGIGHLGLSEGGRIANNDILFNESFNQGQTVHGGGILIAGGAAAIGELSPGSGSVVVEANRVLGNLAGAGDGGGVALVRVNGQDVADHRNDADRWYGVDLFDNIIVNNVAALAGGGISLFDVVKANIVHNTVAHNETTATAGQAFTPGFPDFSNPQPAGIVSRAHSTELNAAVGRAGHKVPNELKEAFANPQLVDTIVWQNRSFYFFGDPLDDPPLYQLRPVVGTEPVVYWDLAVLPAGMGFLSPTYSVLTSLDALLHTVNTSGDLVTTPDSPNQYNTSNNITGDPLLTDAYFNGPPAGTVIIPEPLFVAAAFDEGGNFIQVRFGPLTLEGTDRDTLYHTGNPSAGLDLTGTFPALADDFDGETRPNDGDVDIGADEYHASPVAVLAGISAAVAGSGGGGGGCFIGYAAEDIGW